MDFLYVLRIISCLGIVVSSSVMSAEHQRLSIAAEQKYWNDWSLTQAGRDSPLQPFLFTHSKKSLLKADDLIKLSPDRENVALLARANIDNGLLHVVYFAWDDTKDSRVDIVEVAAINGTPVFKTVKKTQMPVLQDVERLGEQNEYVDTSKKQILDADSFYLTIKRGRIIRRFAAYSPSVEKNLHKSDLEVFVTYLKER